MASSRTLPRWWVALLSLTLLPLTASSADHEDPMRQVSFQVESTREVENDWVTAQLAFTAEETDPAALAERVNKTMTWALDRAKREKAVEVRTGGYRTFPISDKGKIRRWRASQELLLESGEPEKLSALVGELQAKLQVGSIAFSISPDLRRKTEDGLIDDALVAFRARAERIQKSLGAKSYEIVQLDVQTQGGTPPPAFRQGMVRSMEAASAPAIEGGQSTVRVGVRATIELR